ncbi:MAG: hypothetical protein AAGK17_12995 [Pseudomonadota bacterium]
MRTKTQLLGMVSATALVVMSSTPAMAEGIRAGTDITNNVTVQYQVGGVQQTDATDSDTFTVDRRVNVDVTAVGPAVNTNPGAQNAALAFDVTNLSNDDVDLSLDAVLTAGTAANISNIEIYLDADGNGVLSAAELSAGPITFLDEVEADETVRVIVVGDIDLAAADGDSFDIALVADAHEAGAAGLGAELTESAGDSADPSVVDTVLADGNGGTGEEVDNDGADSDENTLNVQGADVSVVKSSVVISDPVNGTTNPKAIPGATILYCIAVENTGSQAATNVNVLDDLPAEVDFDSGFGIFVDATATIDASGATPVATCTVPSGSSGGTFSAGGGTGGLDRVSGSLSDVAGGTVGALYFQVTIPAATAPTP